MSTREQEQIDQADFQQSTGTDASTAQPGDDSGLPSDQGSLDSEAAALDKDNIIDDESGPGGRSLRGTRGDPSAADKQIDADVDEAEKAVDA